MKTLSVMLVDDEPLARDELSFLLGQCEGVKVVSQAENATEALQRFEEQPVDLVFVDLRMPGPDGLSLIERLKARSSMLKVIIVTAHSEGALQAFDVEANDYLLKPVRLERLKKSLLRVGAKSSVDNSFERFAVKSERGLSLLNLRDVIAFETRDEHCGQ
ncbi:MAG: response regulator [Myxococcales bacterium]|nr:MAG: response regulator [Myxococcales bacterium]